MLKELNSFNEINGSENQLSPCKQNTIKDVKEYTFSILKGFLQEEINFFIEKINSYGGIDEILEKIEPSNVDNLGNEILLNKRFNDIFLSVLSEGEILEKLNIEPRGVIDRIFDNYKEITNFKGNYKKDDKYTWAKSHFNHSISKLINLDTQYYFERLMKLNQNDFKKALQKTHQTSILWYLNNTKSPDRNDELMKKVFQKIVDTVGIDNLKDNRARGFDNNYYYYINLYCPEVFQKINIEKILDEKSNVSCNKKYLIDKILDTENWFQKVLKMKNPGKIQEELSDDKIIKYVIKNFNDKNILIFLNLINIMKGYGDKKISDENYSLLIDRIFNKIEPQTAKNIDYIENIITNSTILEFINLYIDDFDSFDKLFNEVLKIFVNQKYKTQSNVIQFVNISKYIDNFDFELNLEDINNDFLNFIENNFGGEDITNKYNFAELNIIFNEKISNYKKLGKGNELENYFLIHKDSYNDDFSKNLKEIFKQFNINFTISNIKKIEKEYNEYLGNTEKDYINIIDFLNKSYDVDNKIKFLNHFFNINTKNDNIKVTFEQTLEILNDNFGIQDITKIVSLSEDDTEKLKELINEKYGISNIEEFNINQILNFLDVTIDYGDSLSTRSWFYSNIIDLDKYLDDINKNELIKFNGKTFEVSNKLNDLKENFGNHINDNFKYFLSIFNNLNEEKVINFFNFFNTLNLKTDINGHYNSYSNSGQNLEDIIGNRGDLKDYEDLGVRNKVFLIRKLIQKAIDNDDYLNLENNLEVILKSNNLDFKIEVEDFELLKEKLTELLNKTGGFISNTLLELFLFGDSYYKKAGSKSIKTFGINETIINFKKVTGIKLNILDFQDNDIVFLLKQDGIGLIDSSGKEEKEIIIFFKKHPNNNGKKWEVKDIKEGGKLNKILKHLSVSNRLIEEQSFTLTELDELFSYNLNYYFINRKINKILSYPQGFYYGYFVEFLNYGDRNLFENGEIDDNFPVNYDNFIELMSEADVLLDAPIDNSFRGYNIETQPWTKKWFVEKPERREYLKKENNKIIREYGSLIGLGKLGEDFTAYIKDEKIINIGKFNFAKRELGFDVNMLANYKNDKFEFRGDVLDLYETILELNSELYDIKDQDIIKQENYKIFLKYLKEVEEKFRIFKTSILDKQDFYNKIGEYPSNIGNKILELVSNLSKRGFNYSKRNLLQLIYNEFIFSIKKSKTKDGKTLDVRGEKVERKISSELIKEDISKIIDVISIKPIGELEILEQYNNYFLKKLRSNFSNVLGINKIPNELNQEKTNTIINHVTYLSNMHDIDSYKESVLTFFLSLKLNGLWDSFQKSEDINIEELLNEDHSYNINNYIEYRKQYEVIKSNFSENDLNKIVKEDHSLLIGNVQTISDTLLSINSNNKEFVDLDMYNDNQKILLGFLEKYNKLLGASLANQFMNLEKGIEIRKENIVILESLKKELKIDKWTKEKVLEIQQVLKEINPLIKFYNFVEDYKIDDRIKDFEKLKIPKEDIINIFSKIGEQFTTNSNVLAVSSDIEYLEKLIENSDDITKEEKQVVHNYLESIKGNIKELEDIFKKIKDRFTHLNESIGNNGNQIFNDRINDFSKLIFKGNESKNLISTITSDFDKIIPNIRGCLSCMADECNNDTNLSFGDTNRFFILTNIEGSKNSISDQAVYIFNTNKGYNFVLDTMYGDRSFDLYLSHILLLIKKIKSLDENVGIFIPGGVFSGTAFVNKLKEEDGIKIKNVDNLEIDLNYSASGNIYHEFTSDKGVRESGKSMNRGILISKK